MTCLHLATMGNRECVVSWLANTFGKDLCLVKSLDGVLAIHLATAAGRKRRGFGLVVIWPSGQSGGLDGLARLRPGVDHRAGMASVNVDAYRCSGVDIVLYRDPFYSWFYF
jgi:hypothetical protein